MPKAYRFEGNEVVVWHFGSGVMLLPIKEPWDRLGATLDAFGLGFANQPGPSSQETALKDRAGVTCLSATNMDIHVIRGCYELAPEAKSLAALGSIIVLNTTKCSLANTSGRRSKSPPSCLNRANQPKPHSMVWSQMTSFV